MSGEPRGPTGILLVDKAVGPTSHDVVAAARGALVTRRIGHTGTLDPFASGLLILCVGVATRLAEYFQLPAKLYEAEMRLGVRTSTHDHEGEIVDRSASWRRVTLERLREALSGFVGTIRQQPPAVSAKRVDGQRAHALARRGLPPELPAVPVTVHAIELLAFEPPMVRARVRVGTGTYVRALARDLGAALGCGAHLTRLRRLGIGSLGVERALPSSELGAGHLDLERARRAGSWLEPAEALTWLGTRRLSEDEADRVRVGGAVTAGASPAGEPVRLLHEGRLIAIAERDDGWLRPRKVLVA